MELRIATPEQLRMVFRRDMLEAFPEAELKPLTAMERLWADAEVVDLSGILLPD